MAKALETAKAYANEVLSGERTACYWIQLAAQRFLNDLEREDLILDEADLFKKIKLASNLKQWKGPGAGGYIQLQPHQIFTLTNLFGFKKRNSNGDLVRRFNKSYISIARKNGKTTEEAIKQLLHLLTDNEEGPQVFAAATKEDQAKLVTSDVGGIVKKTPALAKNLRIFETNGTVRRVTNPRNSGLITSVGADSTTLDGLDVSYASIDEFHAFKSDDLRDVLETATGARSQPLIDILTTAGNSVNSPCYRLERICKDVLKGTVEDDSLFTLIFTLDEGDDFRDPAVWEKANPNLGVSKYREDLERKVRQADLESERKRVAILTKDFNVWSQSSVTFIKAEDWKAGEEQLDDQDLSGVPCFGGLDLSSTKDLTALSLVFSLETYYYAKFFLFTNKEQAKSEDRRANYLEWIRKGDLHANEGNAIDLNVIRDKILSLAERYNIQSIAFDRYNSSQLVSDLSDQGLKMSPFSQGITTMSAPTKELERYILEGRIKHEANACMDWQIENIDVKSDSSDNIKIDKSRSSDRVDGPVSLVMALGETISSNTAKPKRSSIWEREGGLL